MSKYTTEVRFICEMNSGFPVEDMSSYTPDQIIAASRAKIFNFSYPIYESGHKEELETKILKHYYTREIGAETVGLWKLWLNERLNLIMPKYNKLYKLEAETLGKELRNIDVESHSFREDDFTTSSDHTRTDNLTDSSDHTRTDNLTDSSDHTRTDALKETSDHTRTDNLANSATETRTDNLTHTLQGTRGTTDKYSDTPQGTVSNVDNGTYLTDYRKIDETSGSTEHNTGTVGTVGSGTNTGTQKNAGTVDHTGTQKNVGTDQHTGTQKNVGTVDHTGTQRNAGVDKNYGDQEVNGWERGYRGTKIYAELMSDYADKVLNIDNMIINDLRDLFILLW